MSLNHILCTDVMGDEILLPVDFMFANRAKMKKPPPDGDKRSKVVAIDKGKEELLDCTVVHVHDELAIAVLETPSRILELLTEAHAYEGYITESEVEDPEPDDPCIGEVVPELSTGSE